MLAAAGAGSGGLAARPGALGIAARGRLFARASGRTLPAPPLASYFPSSPSSPSACSRPSRLRPGLAHSRWFAASASGGGDGVRAAVDTKTALDQQRELRLVEKRIEEHLAEHAQVPAGEEQAMAEALAAERLSASAPSAGDPAAAPAPAQTAPGALRIRDPKSTVVGEAASNELVVRSRTTTGQVLWPATKEDIEILSDSKLLYPAPYEVEGSVIIRLVRLSDPVTSPVGRVIRNRQFGIRGNEKWQLLCMGAVSCLLVYSLGFWQLRRMEWKRDLIETRRSRLAMQRLQVTSSPFPWRGQVQDYVYRVVELRGVFDHHREMLVGPRPGTTIDGETCSGYLVVTPLCLEDGSKVLVNRGHIPADRVDTATRPEVPAWVRVRGVLEEGEVANMVGTYARLKNRPDRNLFVYLLADDLAENASARNHRECAEALVTAFDTLYEDDFKAGLRREMPFSMRHKEDYLLFWADEHTHFNYAMQWFGMGSLIMVMTVYKFIEVMRWKY